MLLLLGVVAVSLRNNSEKRLPPWPPPRLTNHIDIFSFAMVVLEMAEGLRPWHGHSPINIMFMVGESGASGRAECYLQADCRVVPKSGLVFG